MRGGIVRVSLQLRCEKVSSRVLRHARTIQQHLDALTTDVLCHEVGWIGGPADLIDLDDSPINLVLHPQSLRFEMLDVTDPLRMATPGAADESVKHWLRICIPRPRSRPCNPSSSQTHRTTAWNSTSPELKATITCVPHHVLRVCVRTNHHASSTSGFPGGLASCIDGDPYLFHQESCQLLQT